MSGIEEGPFDPVATTNAVEGFLNNCLLKGMMATIMGGGFGFLFGTFFGVNTNPRIPLPGEPKIPLGVQMADHFKEAGRAGLSHARNFAFIGALFATSECLIEKHRGVSDLYNGLYAGCAAGGLIAYKGGLSAMAVGCAGFGAFSLAIDHFMSEEDPRDSLRRFDPYDEAFLAELQAEEEEKQRLQEEQFLKQQEEQLLREQEEQEQGFLNQQSDEQHLSDQPSLPFLESQHSDRVQDFEEQPSFHQDE